MKRILSLFLCAVLLYGMVPAVHSQADTGNTSATAQNNDIGITGTNSFGSLLSKEIQQAQAEAALEVSQFSGGYSVTDLTIEGNKATVTYDSLEDANLIVAIYTEDNMQLLASGHAIVFADESTATVTIKGTMPKYFMASAYLVDMFDYSPLCSAYDTPMYTKDMQDLLNSTVADYESDRVLNLDNTQDTNFAVYTDEVIVIHGGNGINKVISNDHANNRYIIENTDEQFANYATGNILIVRIATIDFDGTTAFITGDTLEIEDVFDYMKLETTGGMEQAELDDSTCDEGVTYEGIVEADKPATRAWEGGAEKELKFSFVVDKEFEAEDDTTVKIAGSFSLSVKTALSFYISSERCYIDTSLELTQEFALDLSSELTLFEIPLGGITIPTPITGVVIDLEPAIVLEASAKLTLKNTIQSKIGFAYDTQGGFQNTSEKTESKPEIEIEGKLFFGIKVKGSVAILDDSIASVGLSATGGLEVTGKRTLKPPTSSLTEDETDIHSCNVCLDISVDFVQKLAVELEFLYIFKEEFEFTQIKFTICKLYASLDHNELGFGSCPHKAYRVTFEVLDDQKKPVSDVIIYNHQGAYWGTTNSNGIFVKYLVPDNYDIAVHFGYLVAQKRFNVSSAAKLSINIEENGINVGPLINQGNPEDFSDDMVYASGECGVCASWELTYGGNLTISGFGEMFHFSDRSPAPWYEFNYKIKKVVIETGITNIGNYAFNECYGLTTVSIPNSVTSIGNSAFFRCEFLTSVTVPNGVTEIGTYAFANCFKLTDITLPNTIDCISEGMLASCLSLEQITIPSSVTSIGYYAFRKCKSLISITIPEGVTFIDCFAFEDCISLQYVYLPYGVTTIENGAFEDCSALLSVNIPDSVTTIGQRAFAGCDSLKTVIISKNVTTIEESTFIGCDSLTDITLPDGLTTIEDRAFEGCTSLKNITIPNSVKTLGDGVFVGCTSLMTVTLPSDITYISGGIFENCTSLRNFTIPDSVTIIKDRAFGSCYSLTAITIPDNVASIGYDAFRYCVNLESIIIPNKVRSIGKYAFAECTKLSTIMFTGDAPTMNGGLFEGVTATVYYPAGNATWTENKMQNYGGNLTWVSYTPEKAPQIRQIEVATATLDEILPLEEATVATDEIVEESNISADEVPDAQPAQSPETRGIFGGEYGIEATEEYIVKSAFYKDLVPNQEYLFLALISTTIEQPLAPSNILFVDQAAATEDGTLEFHYVQRTQENVSYVVVCGPSNQNLQDAVVTFPVMYASDELQAVHPTVVYNGITLTEGRDYVITGTVDFTKAGNYTCYIRGIYNYTGIVTCTYTVLDDSTSSAWNITLGDQISMNFYLDIDAAIANTAKVNITLVGNTKSYPVADCIADPATGKYVFTADLAAAQMMEVVTVELLNQNEVISTKTYSVRQYADIILSSDEYGETVRSVVREMLNYGAMAQIYFGYDAENPANTGITPVAKYEIPEIVHNLSVIDNIAGLDFYGASLVYRDRIAVRFYFKGDISGCSFSANGNTYEPACKDDMYYVEITDILPQNLDHNLALTVADKNHNEILLSYSPMNYIVRMNQKGNEDLKALAKALYNYHLAAKAYYEETRGFVRSWNVALDDQLKVNFLLNVTDSNARLHITAGTQSLSWDIADLPKTADGLYTATVNLSAAEMMEQIVLQLVTADRIDISAVYSVRSYCDTVLADESQSQYHALIKEMLHYGAMSQLYFGYNTNNLANEGITGGAALPIPETTTPMTVNDQSNSLNFYGASLVYRDRIAVRYYFTGDVTGCTFTANGKNCTPVAEDGMNYVEIVDILPQNLDQQITLTVTNGSGDRLCVVYGPMNYIVRMYGKGNENTKNLLKALYNYHLAAKKMA